MMMDDNDDDVSRTVGSNDLNRLAWCSSSGILLMGIFRSSALEETTAVPPARAADRARDLNNMVDGRKRRENNKL